MIWVGIEIVLCSASNDFTTLLKCSFSRPPHFMDIQPFAKGVASHQENTQYKTIIMIRNRSRFLPSQNTTRHSAMETGTKLRWLRRESWSLLCITMKIWWIRKCWSSTSEVGKSRHLGQMSKVSSNYYRFRGPRWRVLFNSMVNRTGASVITVASSPLISLLVLTTLPNSLRAFSNTSDQWNWKRIYSDSSGIHVTWWLQDLQLGLYHKYDWIVPLMHISCSLRDVEGTTGLRVK